MGWIEFPKIQPEDIVREYLTIDSSGDIKVLEWYEGSCFRWSSGGHWSDEDGNEIENIVGWQS